MQYLDTKSEGTIGTITLNHPEKRNALSTPLVDAIVETLDGFARERMRVVVFACTSWHEDMVLRSRCPRTSRRRS